LLNEVLLLWCWLEAHHHEVQIFQEFVKAAVFWKECGAQFHLSLSQFTTFVVALLTFDLRLACVALEQGSTAREVSSDFHILSLKQDVEQCLCLKSEKELDACRHIKMRCKLRALCLCCSTWISPFLT
jgi:hypothetical protein